MDGIELKQKLLNGKKTDRIIFAVTPDLKRIVTEMAKQDCVSTSAFISALLAEEAVGGLRSERIRRAPEAD